MPVTKASRDAFPDEQAYLGNAALSFPQRQMQSKEGDGIFARLTAWIEKEKTSSQPDPYQTIFPPRFNPGNMTGHFWPARNEMQPQEPLGRGVARKTVVEFVPGCQSSGPTSCRGSLDQPQKKLG
jgi:hypothetical protein